MNETIQFGTDGWRAIIADGFTFGNVRRVAQATCDVLVQSSKSRLILIGYDRRFFSLRFAEAAAQVALANGFKVEVSDRAISSPCLSFNVKSRKAAMGFMFTASHNPYTFNGFKLKGPHGGSMDPDFTKKVEDRLDGIVVKTGLNHFPKTNFMNPYIDSLKKLVNLNLIQRMKGSVVFDAMHGPGGDIMDQLLNHHSHLVYLRKNEDPFFGGTAPEPIEINLTLMKESIKSTKAIIGLGVDGDVDRIGVIDDKGRYLPPHTVMPLILLHLLENRKLKGKVVQTVSMGYLPGRIAAKFKLPWEEVAVGFKHIAKKMGESKVVFGGEESGGYGVGLWAPERDGILCSLLLLEMLAMKKSPLSVVVADLEKRFGASHFKRVDFALKEPVDKAAWTSNIMPHLGTQLGAHQIKQVNTLDGIKIVTTDDSWVLLRPSGTEPLIRTYAEGTSSQIVEDLLKEADRLVHIPPPQPEKPVKNKNGKNKKKKAGRK